MSVNTKILKSPQEKLDILDRKMLTTHYRNLFRDLWKYLTALEEATGYPQEQSIVTSVYVLPCVIGLEAALNNLYYRCKTGLVTALKKSLKN